MRITVLFSHYLLWHYTRAIASFFQIWKNFFWFFFQYFSIGLLLRTLFSPWHRMRESRGRGFALGEWASAFLVNSIMRLIGFLMRLILISLGLIAEIMVFLAGIACFFVWLFMPAVILTLLILGISLLFK